MTARKSDSDLITIADAQKEFSVGRMTIFRALKDGRLERHKRGIGDRRTYVSRSALEKLTGFMEGKR
jgi:hypothetical protein